ncbi:hypothetical protein DPMN_141671 [Dreissena polymorpha]|uniref:Uncharacterized protein n=1 Tax=Dreissena polymorpha TaxID=45954 RepID=A0A9D4G9X8_DREPO|nr:hypothetical protein DPMN_141671 [Dreissena polymorpha]
MFLGHWLARTKVQEVNGVRTCLIYLDILKIVPEPTMTNRAPLSLMNRLKKPIELSVIYLDILKIVPEPTMTNQAPLSLMNQLKKPIELSVSQSVSQSVSVSVCPSVRKL